MEFPQLYFCRNISLLRACRLGNFYFVGTNSLIAIQAELQARIGAFPRLSEMKPQLEGELEEYHRIAQAATQTLTDHPSPEALWDFWRANILQLPQWFRAASIIALVFVSSASVERIFSLYDALFGSEFEST